MSKRRHARVRIHRRVDYHHAGGHGQGKLVDLSLGGCRIEGVSAGASGTRLRLQLWLPDQAHPVKIELAAVQWVKHDQFGVRFLQVSPDARVRLAQVFQSLHEAQQQPEARVIQVIASPILGAKKGSLGRGARRGFWEPMDNF